jgi:hypothetical protein
MGLGVLTESNERAQTVSNGSKKACGVKGELRACTWALSPKGKTGLTGSQQACGFICRIRGTKYVGLLVAHEKIKISGERKEVRTSQI